MLEKIYAKEKGAEKRRVLECCAKKTHARPQVKSSFSSAKRRLMLSLFTLSTESGEIVTFSGAGSGEYSFVALAPSLSRERSRVRLREGSGM